MNKQDKQLLAILLVLLVAFVLLTLMLKLVYNLEKKPLEEPVVETVVIEQPIEEPIEPEAPKVEKVSLGKYRITAYCSCEICCGEYAKNRPVDKDGNVFVAGANGVGLKAGVHCASPLPFGTVVEIENIGTYEVQDRTAKWIAEKYDNRVIDIYFDNHEAAWEFASNTNAYEEVYKIEQTTN